MTTKPGKLHHEWVEYIFRHLDEAIDYDYFVAASIRRIEVSRDISRHNGRLVSKTVEDGFE